MGIIPASSSAIYSFYIKMNIAQKYTIKKEENDKNEVTHPKSTDSALEYCRKVWCK